MFICEVLLEVVCVDFWFWVSFCCFCYVFDLKKKLIVGEYEVGILKKIIKIDY